MSDNEQDNSFAGKVVLVTGSSRGIGRACIQHFARAGASVVVNALHHPEDADELVAEINAQFPEKAIKVQADVTDEAAVDMLFKTVIDHWGRLDVLVNNAGIHRDGLLMRMPLANFQQVIDVNLKSLFLCCKQASRLMLKQKSGRIVNIASVVGRSGNAGQTNYAASKAGVIAFTQSLAQELAARQITVNAVAPGFIDSDMTRHFSDAQREKILQKIPQGRFGGCDEVAEVVLFLSSDRCRYVTGQTLNVDGGMVMM